MKKIVNINKVVGLIIIGALSFYALSVKFGQGESNESYILFTIEILRGFSVGSSVIALLGSSLNLLIIKAKYDNTGISGYNFRIFATVYNLMAGIVFGCGIFTYGGDAYIVARAADPLNFSVTIVGHLVVPILMTIYCYLFCDYYVTGSYYKKDFFLSLIFPSLYGLFMLFHSFFGLHQYRVKGIDINRNVGFISPYGFLSGFIYGGYYGLGAMMVFGIITLTLTLIMNLLNNVSLKNRKVKLRY